MDLIGYISEIRKEVCTVEKRYYESPEMEEICFCEDIIASSPDFSEGEGSI